MGPSSSQLNPHSDSTKPIGRHARRFLIRKSTIINLLVVVGVSFVIFSFMVVRELERRTLPFDQPIIGGQSTQPQKKRKRRVQHKPHDPTFLALDKTTFDRNLISHFQSMQHCNENAAHTLAFIVPYHNASDDWLHRMRDMLPTDIIQNSYVFIVQQSKGTMNPGFLYNVGFDYVYGSKLYQQHLLQRRRKAAKPSRGCQPTTPSFDYVVLHDGLALPRAAEATTFYAYRPKPTILRLDSDPSSRSALISITSKDFATINGYSATLLSVTSATADAQYADFAKRVEMRLHHTIETFGGNPTSPQRHEAVDKRMQVVASGLTTTRYSILNETFSSLRGWNITQLVVQKAVEHKAAGRKRKAHKAMGHKTVAQKAEEHDTVEYKTVARKSKAHQMIHHGVAPDIVSTVKRKLSCDQTFGVDSIHLIAAHDKDDSQRCIQHEYLGWTSCQLGTIILYLDRITGSMGGEDVNAVLGRAENEERLLFKPGAIQLSRPIPTPYTRMALTGLASQFLSAAEVINTAASQLQHSDKKDETIHLLIDRGDYANPCMSMTKMYNVFLVLSQMDLLHAQHHVHFLDGYAHTSLDDLWTVLFTNATHLKQSEQHVLHNAILVDTASTLGDEGVRRLRWDTSCNGTQSTVRAFRDFVLDKLNLTRSQSSQQLTLLTRRDYIGHPRSDGITDRKLANVTADAAYLRSLYPQLNMNIVRFETMPVREQIRVMTQTHVFIGVHGAGNVFSMFLPDDATFVEYFPPQFWSRVRFEMIAHALGIEYVKRRATVVERLSKNRVTVRLRAG